MAVRLGPDTNVDAGKPTRNQEFQARYNSLTDKQKDAYSKKWLGEIGKSAAFLGEAASYTVPIPVAQIIKPLKHMPKKISTIAKWIKNLGGDKAATQTFKQGDKVKGVSITREQAKNLNQSMKDLGKGGTQALARGERVAQTQKNIEKIKHGDTKEVMSAALERGKTAADKLTAGQVVKNVSEFAGSGSGAVKQTIAAGKKVVPTLFGAGKKLADRIISPIPIAVVGSHLLSKGGDEEEKKPLPAPDGKSKDDDKTQKPPIGTRGDGEATGHDLMLKYGKDDKKGSGGAPPLIPPTGHGLMMKYGSGNTTGAKPDPLKKLQNQNEMGKLTLEMAERKRKAKEEALKRSQFSGYGTRGFGQYQDDLKTTQATRARESSEKGATGLDYLRSGEEVTAQNRMRRFRLRKDRV